MNKKKSKKNRYIGRFNTIRPKILAEKRQNICTFALTALKARCRKDLLQNGWKAKTEHELRGLYKTCRLLLSQGEHTFEYRQTYV